MAGSTDKETREKRVRDKGGEQVWVLDVGQEGLTCP